MSEKEVNKEEGLLENNNNEEKKEEEPKETEEEAKIRKTKEMFNKQVKLLLRATSTGQVRYVQRAVRKLLVIRREVPGSDILSAVEKSLTELDDSSFSSFLPASEGEKAMDIDNDEENKDEVVEKKSSIELETFLHLLTVLNLLDAGKLEDAAECAASLLKKVESFSQITLNPIAAKAYFYYARVHELKGGNGKEYGEIRPVLLAAYRTASLQHANECQMTLINALLRNFLHYSLYGQADKLASKIGRLDELLTDGSASNNQIARYLYYQGRIKAIELSYDNAFEYLEEALRQAPRKTAKGFRLTTYKILIIVQLLMGEIPEKSVFRQTGMRKELLPYFRLAKAVRAGNLESYAEALKEFTQQFQRDYTYSLVLRLRNNVIKTGLKKINNAYSRIGFKDICEKLKLDSVKDTQYVVSKAIKDGVIDATINVEGGYITSTQKGNIYSTQEPLQQFHKRIEFCLNIRNEAVKAMRYPETAKTEEVLKEKVVEPKIEVLKTTQKTDKKAPKKK